MAVSVAIVHAVDIAVVLNGRAILRLHRAPRSVVSLHARSGRTVASVGVANRDLARSDIGVSSGSRRDSLAGCVVARGRVVARTARALSPVARVGVLDIAALARSHRAGRRVVRRASVARPLVARPRVVARAAAAHRVHIAPLVVDIASGRSPAAWAPCVGAVRTVSAVVRAPVRIRTAMPVVVADRPTNRHARAEANRPARPRVVAHGCAATVSHRHRHPHR